MTRSIKRSILVVDDDEDIRCLLQRYLQDLGYLVAIAENGEEGLRKASEHAFDLIFLDHTMPAMTGPETLRALRDRGLDTKVVVITGSTEDAVFDEFMTPELDVDGFVNKPLDPEQIEKCIEQVLLRGRKLLSPR